VTDPAHQENRTMATKTKRITWTAAQIRDHVRNIGKAVARHKEAQPDRHFTSITPEQIAAKLKRVHSPMIVSQGWNSTIPGGIVHYSLGLYNPDPVEALWLFAHVWVGSGNVDPTPGTFLSNVDARFARLTQPAFDGLRLAPAASTALEFELPVPAAVPPGNYLGNSSLMQFNWHDVGTALDRGVFVFGVA
jgi:hypothetical protein